MLHVHVVLCSDSAQCATSYVACVQRSPFNGQQELYPYFQYAHDGIMFAKNMLMSKGYWSGAILDVSKSPTIVQASKRTQNDYILRQAHSPTKLK